MKFWTRFMYYTYVRMLGQKFITSRPQGIRHEFEGSRWGVGAYPCAWLPPGDLSVSIRGRDRDQHDQGAVGPDHEHNPHAGYRVLDSIVSECELDSCALQYGVRWPVWRAGRSYDDGDRRGALPESGALFPCYPRGDSNLFTAVAYAKAFS